MFATALALFFATTPPAAANGQTTHVWISRHALTHIADADLRAFLTAPDQEAPLVHGTMFPDGGYPIGHAYAETAHWEPFQGAYLDWIRATCPAPSAAGDCARHTAFLFGMASHGMADQTFDAFYFNWSSIKDADHGWAEGHSFDEASDFIWASLHGGQEVPPRWLPEALFIDLYADFGIAVDADAFDSGHDLLETAIALVGFGAQNPTLVQQYADRFPWGGAHLDDPHLPGTPACEGEVVARYWEELWARLHGRPSPRTHLGTWPHDGDAGHGTALGTPEARVSVILPRGLVTSTVTPDRFTLEGPAGPIPFTTWVFYGDNSHIVHLVPTVDLPVDADFTATVLPGLPFRDGTALESEVRWAFSTRPRPPEDTGPAPDTADGDGDGTPDGGGRAKASPGGGCHGAPTPIGLVLALGGALVVSGRRRFSSGDRREGAPSLP